MYDFSPDAVLMVLASEVYKEEDYIRDYDTFLKMVKAGEHKIIKTIWNLCYNRNQRGNNFCHMMGHHYNLNEINLDSILVFLICLSNF